MNYHRLMAVVMVLLGLMTTGCAGLGGFQIRVVGMDPHITNAINRAGERLAEACEGGVEHDRRKYRYQSVPRPDDGYPYPGNVATTDTEFSVECRRLPGDVVPVHRASR